MPVTVVSKRRRRAVEEFRADPGVVVHDVTSKGEEPWVRFSPFYPHGGIPVPFSPGVTAMSVEGIWQALKVFESADVDLRKLEVADMRNLKRTARRFGRVLGHRAGVHGTRLLPYVEARRAIDLPSYWWVLDHRVADLVRELRSEAARGSVVLLDYTDNVDVDDVSRPLSHAGLVVAHVEHPAGDDTFGRSDRAGEGTAGGPTVAGRGTVPGSARRGRRGAAEGG